MLELWIDDQRVEINHQDVEVVYAITDISDFEKAKSSYTKTIQCPATAANELVFKYLVDVNNHKFDNNILRTAHLYDNGVEILAGHARVEKITTGIDTWYEVTISSRVKSLFDDLGDYKFRGNTDPTKDIDISANNCLLNPTEIFTANQAALGVANYRFPLIDYGWNLNSETIGNLYPHQLYPALHVSYIWDQVLAKYGYTYEGDIFLTNEWQSLIMPYVGDGKPVVTGSTSYIFDGTLGSDQLFYFWSVPPMNDQFRQLAVNNETTDIFQIYNQGFSNGTSNHPGNMFRMPEYGDYVFQIDIAFKDIVDDGGGTLTWVQLVRCPLPMYQAGDSINYVEYLDLYNVPEHNFEYLSEFEIPTVEEGTTYSFNGAHTCQQGDIIFWRITTTATQLKAESGSRIRVLGSLVENDQYFQDQVIDFNKCLPKTITQKQFVTSLRKMYNLYVESDPDNDTHLKFYTRDQFYSGRTAVDWTAKVDLTEANQEYATDPFAKIILKYKDDTDYYNTRFKTAAPTTDNSNVDLVEEGMLFGTKVINNTDEYHSLYGATKEITVDFSPTLSYKLDLVNSPLANLCHPVSGITLQDIFAYHNLVVPAMYSVDAEGNKQFSTSWNDRILSWYGVRHMETGYQVPLGNSFGISYNGTVTASENYPCASHYSDPSIDDVNGTSYTSNFDLNFGTMPEYYAMRYQSRNNLYRRFWQNTIDTINDSDLRLVTLQVYLTELDILNLDLKQPVYIDHPRLGPAYYVINKLTYHQPLSSVELIKLDFLETVYNNNIVYPHAEPINLNTLSLVYAPVNFDTSDGLNEINGQGNTTLGSQGLTIQGDANWAYNATNTTVAGDGNRIYPGTTTTTINGHNNTVGNFFLWFNPGFLTGSTSAATYYSGTTNSLLYGDDNRLGPNTHQIYLLGSNGNIIQPNSNNLFLLNTTHQNLSSGTTNVTLINYSGPTGATPTTFNSGWTYVGGNGLEATTVNVNNLFISGTSLTNYISSAVTSYTANNGIVLSGTTFQLGGKLIKDTTVTGDDKYDITWDYNPLWAVDHAAEIRLYSFDSNTSIYYHQLNLARDFSLVMNDQAGDAYIKDLRTVKKGLEYFANYHAGYTLRSLVDKEYVDGYTTSALTAYSLTSHTHTQYLGGTIANGQVAFGSGTTIAGSSYFTWDHTARKFTLVGVSPTSAYTTLDIKDSTNTSVFSVLNHGGVDGYYVSFYENALDNIKIGSDSLNYITTGSGNVALGGTALRFLSTGSNNVGIGSGALHGDTGYMTGSNNIGLGVQCGKNMTSGAENVLLGTFAGYSITNGGSNILMGYAAGFPLTTGSNNVALGNSAGYYMKTGASNNIALGQDALRGHSVSGLTTNYNIGIGYQAGLNLTTAIHNILVGFQAGYTNTTGNHNIALGYQAGYNTTTGSSNIFIGNSAGSNTTTSNRLCIDNRTRGTQAGEQANSLIYGIFDSTSSNQHLYLNAYTHVKHGLTVGPNNSLAAANTIAGGEDAYVVNRGSFNMGAPMLASRSGDSQAGMMVMNCAITAPNTGYLTHSTVDYFYTQDNTAYYFTIKLIGLIQDSIDGNMWSGLTGIYRVDGYVKVVDGMMTISPNMQTATIVETDANWDYNGEFIWSVSTPDNVKLQFQLSYFNKSTVYYVAKVEWVQVKI